MKKQVWSLGIAGCLYLETVSGAESTNTIPESTLYGTNALLVTQAATPSTKLLDRWMQEMVPIEPRILYQRYGPPSSFMWIDLYDSERYGIHAYADKYGRRTMTKTMGAGAREAAVSTFPLEDWGDSWKNWGGAIWSKFIRGSIGNTEEEDAKAVSATPSYNSLKHIVHFEWNETDDSWNGEYGWRPWRDNPYVYLNNNFGHYAGRQFLRTEVRCYGYLRPNSFGIIKTEASAIFTLSEKSQLVLGGFAYPLENEERFRPQGSVRIETYWHKVLFSLGTISTIRGVSHNITAEFEF